MRGAALRAAAGGGGARRAVLWFPNCWRPAPPLPRQPPPRPRPHPVSVPCISITSRAVSVALPEWFFSKDKQAAPLILLVLLFGGIVAPLGLVAWYLRGTQK